MIFLGSDHGGFFLKESIKKYLDSKKIEYSDLGAHDNNPSNYAIYARDVGIAVSLHHGVGILCCSSGIGVSIAANKVKGIRAALCTSPFHAEFSRRHNDANVICFGSKVTSEKDAISMVEIFLNTNFEGNRHIERLQTIDNIENMI